MWVCACVCVCVCVYIYRMYSRHYCHQIVTTTWMWKTFEWNLTVHLVVLKLLHADRHMYKHAEANRDVSVFFSMNTCKSGTLGINRPAKFLCSSSHLSLLHFMQQNITLELLLFDPEEKG